MAAMALIPIMALEGFKGVPRPAGPKLGRKLARSWSAAGAQLERSWSAGGAGGGGMKVWLSRVNISSIRMEGGGCPMGTIHYLRMPTWQLRGMAEGAAAQLLSRPSRRLLSSAQGQPFNDLQPSGRRGTKPHWAAAAGL